jgi:hypothetical protein
MYVRIEDVYESEVDLNFLRVKKLYFLEQVPVVARVLRSYKRYMLISLDFVTMIQISMDTKLWG